MAIEDEDDDFDARDMIDELDEENFQNFRFADPNGESALRAATPDNPRNLPCPACGQPNKLTPLDKAHGYQCDECARKAEMGID